MRAPQASPIRVKNRPKRVMLRVVKGGLEPADGFAREVLRSRCFRVGDIVSAEIRKPRNPGFHRLAHRIGQLCADNIADFSGMEAHSVLKRLQVEARIGCDELGLKIPGVGYVVQFIPRSLSFESMDEDEFRSIVRALCRHIAEHYWPTLSAEQIEQMAETFVDE